jgi:hypothetical protein
MKIYCMLLAALAVAPAWAAEPTWFAPDAASKQSLEDALATAKKSNHRLIVIYDGGWCTLCTEVHNGAMADPDLLGLVHSGYEVVRVKTDDSTGFPRFASEALHQPLDKANGLLITVLEKDGSVLATWTAGRLMADGHFSAAKLKQQLSEFLVGAPADEVYRTALASMPNGKAGWVEFRADWCGWCKRMERFFGDSKAAPVLAKYYQVITIDTEKNHACRAGRGKGEVLAGTGPFGEEPRLRPGGNWTYRKTGRGERGFFVEVMA